MLRRILVMAALALAGTAAGAGATMPVFKPGAGLRALDTAATGVYELGSVRFGNESGRLLALVHHGRVLQVHGRHDARWLAKRSGSSGGKAIAPTKFDELASIAGGLNHDVGLATAATRQNFARAAGLVVLDDETSSHTASSDVRSAARLQLVAVASASACGAIGCGVIHRQGAASSERFVISADPDGGLWSFEGYGIVAIWPVPLAD